jgi:dimethylhistidine N-methyltransferase
MPSGASLNDDLTQSIDADREELLAGLCARRPFISPKYLYDELGSRLFAAITELDEYYPTRIEAGIMAANAAGIAAALGEPGMSLIDLGAGDCRKAARLFETLAPSRYVPVDISAAFLDEAVQALGWRFPRIEMTAVGADFSRRLELPMTLPFERRLFFYPGSSIGNFTPDEARAFLGRLREAVDESGGLLIGIDLVKEAATLQRAYDDALGVTAAFNLNILRNANRIAGTDFVPSDWRHVARFNGEESRIEMHLEARRPVVVRWCAQSRSSGAGPGDTGAEAPESDAEARDGGAEAGQVRFESGERIHTESSYKYRLEDFGELLAGAGFRVTNTWTDPADNFAVVLARPA